jgi:hypothetical protein
VDYPHTNPDLPANLDGSVRDLAPSESTALLARTAWAVAAYLADIFKIRYFWVLLGIYEFSGGGGQRGLFL